YIIGFAFAAGSFAFLTFGVAWLVSHRNRGDVHKGLPSASGIDTYCDTPARFGLSFYIYALLLVAFGFEVVFISLWAVVFRELPAPADPNAYEGGRPAEVTHVAEFGATQAGRRDDARWSGVLEVIPTKADYVLDLLRANSLWPLLSGLACCAIEMMSYATSKNDIDRWGAFPFRASPRQADVLIVAGTLTTKMAGPLLRLWEQMPEPKWCVAMGDCTC